jgi:hypothetical protein
MRGRRREFADPNSSDEKMGTKTPEKIELAPPARRFCNISLELTGESRTYLQARNLLVKLALNFSLNF